MGEVIAFTYVWLHLQVKCPECRAEHRIPYNGVQAFPTNVTLQRFLELHIEITGELPDPTSGKSAPICAPYQVNQYKDEKRFIGI